MGAWENLSGARIVFVGRDSADYGYVLADRTCHASPHGWASAAVKAYDEFGADRLVAEVDHGGEMVGHTVRTVRPAVPFRAVHASRGKAIRAEPIAALYEQGRIRHASPFPALVDQLTTWVPGDASAKSPDRLDALVWGLTELGLSRAAGARKVKGPRR